MIKQLTVHWPIFISSPEMIFFMKETRNGHDHSGPFGSVILILTSLYKLTSLLHARSYYSDTLCLDL